jgi:glutathione S-transferase
MKLFYSPASPFVRKVMVLLTEAGLDQKVERVAGATTPVKPDAALQNMNPVAKMPALSLDSGETLYDSAVICEYLDTEHLASRFFPRSGRARWTALRRQALGDGLLDAAILVRYESAVRPPDRQWPEWSAGQWGKVEGALSEIEREAPTLGDTYDIGTITLACALGYLDFRFADRGWRTKFPKAAAWYARFNERPALKKTAPPPA